MANLKSHIEMTQSLTYKTSLFMNFRYGDPAGVMFNGNLLDISHDLLEEFLIHIGISWKNWFRSEKWACPIRNCNIDFLSPLIVGETYDVEIKIIKIGKTSFTINYIFLTTPSTQQFGFTKNHSQNSSQNTLNVQIKKVAEIQVTHVFIDMTKKAITEIPIEFKVPLNNYLHINPTTNFSKTKD